MNDIMKTGIILLASATLGLAADTFTGQLVDADCKTQADSSTKALDTQGCAVKPTTRVFAIETPDSKLYRLDSAGNEKARAAMAKDLTKTNVTISGSWNGQTMKVDSIDLSK